MAKKAAKPAEPMKDLQDAEYRPTRRSKVAAGISASRSGTPRSGRPRRGRPSGLSIVSSSMLRLSVVVPTFNEAGNVRELLRRVENTLGAEGWELIFVDDDSPDGTASLVRDIARADGRVRVLQRIGRRGLSSACIEGMLSASAPVIAIMDADLQHDETRLPVMLQALESGRQTSCWRLGTRAAAARTGGMRGGPE